MTACFSRFMDNTRGLSEEDIAAIENFVFVLYSKPCQQLDVNSARLSLFTKKARQIDHIPPTSAALLQHLKRAMLQAALIWGQASEQSIESPNPADWGRTATNGCWQPFWTYLPEASHTCRELVKCSCNTTCKSRCNGWSPVHSTVHTHCCLNKRLLS